MIEITKKCPFTGKMNTRKIPVAKAKYDKWERGETRALIQQYFPELSPDDREFILTGCTPEMWDEKFKDG